uniref:Uncharacterized protein n=1 Tax=Caenorhabditis japonica TaxID=281687 RepID=A0A8R1DES1_CAEJA
MPGQQSPIRGGFQGGYRGGRGGAGGVGGHMDFAAGQGHAMGRGRGHATQPFVPQPRSTPPPFQTVVPTKNMIRMRK